MSKMHTHSFLRSVNENVKPVGWFTPWNDIHGYQQVAKQYEGGEGLIPLYSKETVEKLCSEIERLREAVIEECAKVAETTQTSGADWIAERIRARAALASAAQERAND